MGVVGPLYQAVVPFPVVGETGPDSVQWQSRPFATVHSLAHSSSAVYESLETIPYATDVVKETPQVNIMGTNKRTVSVRLDDESKQRIKTAAKLTRQSVGAFLPKAGEDRSKLVLLEWALARHRRGEASFSELTEQTGLAVGEIIGAVGDSGRDEGLEMFLARCRTVAKIRATTSFCAWPGRRWRS